MTLVMISFLLCCMLQAEPHDENTPLFVGRPGKMPHFSRELWRSKIKTCLAQENQVKVFYFPREEEIYSVTYDVSSSEVGVGVAIGLLCGKRWEAILPTSLALQQEYLQGYTLRVGGPVPRMTKAESSEKGVNLKDYSKKSFFSKQLDDFLATSCPALAKRGKGVCDDGVTKLTADMLKKALPVKKTKQFLWKIVDEDRALDILQKRRKKPEVLLVIGGVGMLWGRRKTCLFEPLFGINHRSLLFYKLHAKVCDDMCAKYPFDQKRYKLCLNY